MVAIMLIIQGWFGWHVGNVLANGPKDREFKPGQIGGFFFKFNFLHLINMGKYSNSLCLCYMTEI